MNKILYKYIYFKNIYIGIINMNLDNEFDLFEDLIDKLKDNNYLFITESFKLHILNTLQKLYPKLNKKDLEILSILTAHIIDDLSIRIFYIKTINDIKEEYYFQWKQNNSRDILVISLMIIPFMSDDNNNFRYNNITDLSQILYDKTDKDIDKTILKKELKEVLKDELKYSNFSIGLLDNSKDKLLTIDYGNNRKLIYIIMHHQFCSTLETIKITNGKMYINWINYRPLSKPLIKSQIYLDSKEELKYLSLSNENAFKENMNENKSLWFGDYYNVMRNGYYESIKKIKWILFNKKIFYKEKAEYYGIYMIQYLDKIFNFKDLGLYDTDSFLNLSNEDQNLFKIQIKKIVNLLQIDNPIYLDFDFEISVYQNLLQWLLNNSHEKFRILTDENLKNYPFLGKFIVLPSDIEEDLDPVDIGEDIEENEITKDDIINLFNLFINQNLQEIIWNYIKETLEQVKSTPYGVYLLKNNMINHKFFNLRDTDLYMNLKNLYNIGKQLSHSTDGNFILLGKNFKNLTTKEQLSFFTSFKDITIRFKKNINIQEGDSNSNFNLVLKSIKDYWDKHNHFLVLNYLHTNGLLSEFVMDLKMTDEKLLPSSTGKRRKQVQQLLIKEFQKKENKHIFKNNYFLTNDSYENLPKLNWKNNKRTNDTNYSKILYKDLVFYTFYAMDWLSQINFFNAFIHHQVIFVTGGTGAGKSTQAPKLLMYALKMYDYKNNGKVICTQPRITPTINNSTRISNELGVQNTKKVQDEDILTDMYHSQYKYQGGRHTKENSNHLTLKTVTDGTLLEEINGNITMLEKIKIPGKTEDFVYSLKNQYDVIIVDEAHEHNTNMDIILTLARNSCFYNNSIRLVIISATMDDDEPIYRSYFQMIDDNKLYPIKQPIQHPVLFEDFFINSGYLERRVHISAPGQSTQYSIDEYYDENIEKRFGNNERQNSLIAQDESYKVVLDICNTTSSGEILLFLTGEAEIKKALTFLNEKLPSDTIALPFYSKMNQKYKDIISDIDIEVNNIRNNKRNIVNDWGEKFVKADSVPFGTYKRSVVIATNVAEASITINGLKYVVDTGYAKENQFDPRLDISKLEVKKISEASRIQRRGRVGRVSAGIVYYMYGKGKRETIKPKYGITQGDFHNNFLKLAVDNDKGKVKELWPDSENENFIKTSLYNNINFVQDKIKSFYPANLLIKFVNVLNIKASGFDHNTLLDLNGNFYIIHPFENNIKRNFFNQIIKYDNMKNNKRSNEQNNYTLEINRSEFSPMLNSIMFKFLYLPIKGTYYKTVFSKKIEEVTRDITSSFLEEREAISILVGSGYGVQLEILEIISMLSACSKTVSMIASFNEKNKKILEFDKLRNRFKTDSDFISIHKICLLLRNKFSNLKMYRLYQNNNILKKYKKIYDDIVNKYKELNNFTIEYDKIKNFIKDYNTLNYIKFNGKLNDNKGFLYWLSSSNIFKNELIDDLKKYEPTIEKIAKDNDLNPQTIKIYFTNLLELMIGILTSEKDQDSNYNIESPFEWIKSIKETLNKSLDSSDIEEKITNTFLLTNPLNIAIRLDINDDYYTTINSQYKVDVGNVFRDKNTLVKNLSSYLFYYNFSEKFNEFTISIVTNINIKKLANLFSIHFNPTNIKNMYYLKEDNKFLYFDGYNWDNFIHQIKKYYSFSNFPLLNKKELPKIYNFIKENQKNIN